MVGLGVGRFPHGSDVFHPEVLGLRRAADELPADNNIPSPWRPRTG
ncbi:hypothetical protein [Streptomyces sp. NBC_00448]